MARYRRMQDTAASRSRCTGSPRCSSSPISTLGVSMVPLPLSPRKLQWYMWHKWIGITVFLRDVRAPRVARAPSAAAARADARLAASRRDGVARPPVRPAAIIPLSGWLYSSSTGVQVVYLGPVPAARPRAEGPDTGHSAEVDPLRIELDAVRAGLCPCRGGARASLRRARRARSPACCRRRGRKESCDDGSMARGASPVARGALLAARAGCARRTCSSTRAKSASSRSSSASTSRAASANGRPTSSSCRRTSRSRRPNSTSTSPASTSRARIPSSEIRDRLWFDTAKFPVAHFASTSIRDLGGDKYEVAGALTIKGIKRDVVVPVAVRKDAAGNSVGRGQLQPEAPRLQHRRGDVGRHRDGQRTKSSSASASCCRRPGEPGIFASERCSPRSCDGCSRSIPH